MEKAKVSVIIPVYNVESYIDKCIVSVLEQTYSNLEIIMVDDCSTDNSFRICQKYAEADKRIKLLKNERNSGVSFSRNRALDVMTGEYVCMIDSDDWVDNDYIERLMSSIDETGADACICGYLKEFENSKETEIYQITDKTKVVANTEILDSALRKSVPFVGYICAKIYRTTVIEAINLRFDTYISLCEDSLFNYSYFDSVKNCALVNGCLYHYRIRPQSLTTYTPPGKIKTKLYAFQNALDIAKKYPASVFYYRVNAVIFGTSMQYMNAVISNQSELSDDEYKKIMLVAKEALSKTKIKYTKCGELIRYYMFLLSPRLAKFILRLKAGRRNKFQ